MSYIEVNFHVQPLTPFRDILLAELSEMNFESFAETETGLQAYVSKSDFQVTLLKELTTSQLPNCEVKYDFREIADQNWNEVWESNFQPIRVGSHCNIRAAFHPVAEDVDEEIIIAPKMAFGTGHHETTWQMINTMATMDLQDKTLLDMGCGTGILAIYAEKKGAKRIDAVDIDEWAVTNTNENLLLNNCVKIDVDKGGADVLEGRSFNVILANINKNVLLADIATYSAALTADGWLLLSGFYEADIADVNAAGAAAGLAFVESSSKNDWAIVRMKKRV